MNDHSYGRQPFSFEEYGAVQHLRRKFSKLSLSFVIYLFVSSAFILLIQIAASALGFSKSLSSNIYWQWAISVAPLYLFGLPAVLLFLGKNRELPIQKKKFGIEDFLLLFLIGRFFTLIGSYASSILIQITERVFHTTISNTTSDLLLQTPTWLIFVGAVIIGPIIEEILYRKLIIDCLHVHGEWLAVLFSATVFALAHRNLYQLIYAFLNGLILAYIYLQTGKIRYCAAYHILTNFLGTIVILPILEAQEKLNAILKEEAMDAQALSLSLLVGGYGLAKLLLALLGAVVLYFCYKRFLPKRKALQPIPEGKSLSVILLNPGSIALLVVSVTELINSIL